jgi:hypothetical protein
MWRDASCRMWVIIRVNESYIGINWKLKLNGYLGLGIEQPQLQVDEWLQGCNWVIIQLDCLEVCYIVTAVVTPNLNPGILLPIISVIEVLLK